MTTLFLRRTPTGFEPASVHSSIDMQRIKVGKEVRCEVKEERNIGFHRKTMDLLRTGFRIWSEQHQGVEYQGVMVKPCFETYRKQMTIQAGYFHYVINLDGTVKPEANSLAFDKMKQDEFEKFFSDVMDAILASVEGCTAEQLMEYQNEIVGYL